MKDKNVIFEKLQGTIIIGGIIFTIGLTMGLILGRIISNHIC